ncbi:ABC1 kinase family protein [Salisediminibacterium halotolerans]|uniref:Predicted unusual protein kinase regulating ubiquinone biosynthesis, AarF/ABC1/UbiB family n=1 Tax=Salisediminibacterium halotolerans TaxID=517425 RepID=A0A1H9TKF7_9BACI|nr:AarF/UbiB family protein [Salisediminibacterium haloalkalitolerans]SER97093.1 Predicted unusual protein kinase regulating ubiquinone biosynthesis, AarF/ABC1/UbiB family [Salisediminibacterium haloalkalitolerans]
MKNFSLYRIYITVYMTVKFIFQLYLFHKRNPSWDATTYEQWEELLRKQAQEYRERAVQLEGLLIKVGQFLSTRADIMPQVFLDELADLIDQVPPVPPGLSMQLLEKEWGQPYTNYLSEISEQPVASASIGEVFKGQLLNGQDVAIKIQRFNIDKIIKADFKSLRIVLWITRKFTKFGREIDTKALYKEVVSTIGDELNYYKELKNGQYFKKKFEDKENYYIPQFYEEYSTRRVLVMEWVDGRKVTDMAFLRQNNIDPIATSEKLFSFFLDQLIDSGKFHADPHQGNIFVTAEGQIIILDFGMIGEITRSDSENIRKMVQGFVLEDYELAVDQLQELGFLLPHADKQRMQNLLKYYIDLYLEQDLNELDQATVEEIFEDLQAIVREQPIQLPAEFAFLGRAASIGLGVLATLNPNIDFLALGKPAVSEWLEEKGSESGPTWQKQVLTESARPLLALPKNINNYLESPKLDRYQADQHQWRVINHQRSMLGLSAAVAVFILFLIVAAVFYYLEAMFLSLSFGVLATAALFLSLILYKSHKRWVNKFYQGN